jgi:hypothetical protein
MVHAFPFDALHPDPVQISETAFGGGGPLLSILSDSNPRRVSYFLTLNLIISSHLGQSLPSDFVPEDFPTTLLYEFLNNTFVLHVSSLKMFISFVSIIRNTMISSLISEHKSTITESLTQRILGLKGLMKTVAYVKKNALAHAYFDL